MNDTCLKLNKIHIYGAVFQFEGQVSVFNYQSGPNYRDFYSEVKNEDNLGDTCNRSGVLGLLPGIIGILQATEAIKIIIGYKSILSGQILTYNALTLSFNKFKIINTKFVLSEKKHEVTHCSDTANKEIKEINVMQLQKILINGDPKYILIDVRSQEEYKKTHLRYSVNMPLKQLKNIHESNINFKNKICCIYCSLDSRSVFASQLLINQNLDIIRVKGGLNAWKNIIG